MPMVVVTNTNWIVWLRLGMMTCTICCHRFAPSILAASSSSASRVAKPARKMVNAMPKVAQMCTTRTVGSAVAGRPSQSTDGMLTAPSAELRGPFAPRMMLKIAPMMMGESTTGRKYTLR
jgi:hypothetical protein